MATQIFEPSRNAGNSTDVTIAAGSTNTVAIFVGTSEDNLLLPNLDDFLLPDGVAKLLLPVQLNEVFTNKDYASIQLKAPDGTYFDSGMYLRGNALFKTLGPGVWRLNKPVTPAEFGFQSEDIDSAVYNSQSGVTYTILASDNGKIITFSNAGACAVTLPDGLDVNFQCTIVQIGVGVPTVTPATDTVNGAGAGVAPTAQWSAMYLSKFAATEWLAVV